MVREVPVCFRKRAQELAAACNEHEIPLLVFSAGLGDVIQEIMRQGGMTVKCMHVVSNMMEFDEAGMVVGFKEVFSLFFNL